MIDLPSTEQVRSILDYDPVSGKLYWLERPREMFPRSRLWKMWNTRYAGKEAFTRNHSGYFGGQIFNKRLLAHRVIWAWCYGEWPVDVIDHIDGDPVNNRIDNLRVVTQSENSKNSRISIRNSSGITGVSWASRDKKWIAYISIEGRRTSLGYFNDIASAVAARKQAEPQFGYHANHGRQHP